MAEPIRLSYLCAARFRGPDATAFLQAQLTADIGALGPGDSTFAAFCTPRGQVLALLLVCREGDEFLVAGSARLLPSVLERLQVYVFRSRVEFALEPELQVFGIPQESQGPAFEPGEIGLRYAFSPGSGEASEQTAAWRRSELERNICWLDEATSEKFIPQMLGYDRIGALSFSKGCYPGQEIVARARYLGRVKRKPLLLALREMPALAAGETVELLRAEDWTRATVIDQETDDAGGGLVLTVTAEAEDAPATELRAGDRSYPCATM
jgi:folate-binding protein YgfZ